MESSAVKDILRSISELPIREMDIEDVMLLHNSVEEFARRVKPIVEKYTPSDTLVSRDVRNRIVVIKGKRIAGNK